MAAAKWISATGQESRVNEHVSLRKFFNHEGKSAAVIRISAHWDFVLYLNEKEIARHQFPDYPDAKTYSELEAELATGDNCIEVLLYNPNEDFFAQNKGPGALYFELVREGEPVVSDESWQWQHHPRFKSGERPKTTVQLGYTVECDLAAPADGNWHPVAVLKNYHPSLSPRPLPPPATAEPLAGTLCKRQGNCLIYDLGQERVGYWLLRFECENSGILEASWGEHLDDGEVRSRIGERTFTDTIITRSGVNRFEYPFRRLGGRYLQLRFSPRCGNVKVFFCGITPVRTQLPPVAPFAGDAPRAAELRNVGIRTLECCMHDHYEDCP